MVGGSSSVVVGGSGSVVVGAVDVSGAAVVAVEATVDGAPSKLTGGSDVVEVRGGSSLGALR